MSDAPVKLRDLARAWLAVGTQSVGGATSTLYLMRARLVERTGWLSRREFMESYAIALLSPGIHLVALAAMLGHRLAGLRGLGVSVAGMMVPAALITVALTAMVAGVSEHPLTRAAFAGVTPVTAGMTAGLGLVTARSAARQGRRGVLDIAVVMVALAVLVVAPGSTVPVILISALAGTVLLRGQRSKGEETVTS